MVYSQKIDKKWQKKWADTGLYKFDESRLDNKLYVLEMFSYPSGRNLHVGHWWNYSLPDSWSRMKRMQGYNVFHPFGFDAFGLPAENYAIKTGIHPMDSTKSNIETMEQQFRTLGATYDWSYEINTCVPEYYKWTQWLFLKLYENNLAYRKEAPVNWCPKCMTVLANEQSAGGICERCETEVIHKNMTQWFFRITDYAEELLLGLKGLDWPEKTKRIQENWIGKSEGAIISFPVVGTDNQISSDNQVHNDNQIDVFTTRLDTIMGASYIVLAPEHPLADQITTPEYREVIDKYKLFAAKQTEIERLSTVKNKTGAFTGRHVRHPFNGSKIPVWISDYVIESYGTGAVMAVPAHDERDFEFAAIYSLPIIQVIDSKDHGSIQIPYTEEGVLINSGEFTGLSSAAAKEQMVTKLENMGSGKRKTSYRLRDWLVSRQRYWGAPIPVVHCEYCGIVPITESKLPVILPYDVAFKPTGESPLATCEEFVKTDCPKCGKPAKRDTDTLDTFVCSSWYYLRFFDNTNDKEPFNSERANKIMPVDKYIGGVEHAAMHLLYARFVTKALRDMRYVDFDEPFKSLIHEGTILASDGLKMSKSRPDAAILPDDYISIYGSDIFRVYLGFGFSYSDGGLWSDDGIKAIARFFYRVERIVDRCINLRNLYIGNSKDIEACCNETCENAESHSRGDNIKYKQNEDLEYARHYAIKHATEDIEKFQFNTAIARIMEYTNALAKYQASTDRCPAYEIEAVADMLLITAPFAPHFCEEMWEMMKREYSIFKQKWPVYDEVKLLKSSIVVAVQVNGVVRDRIFVEPDMNEDELKSLVIADRNVLECINGRIVKRIIVVKNRIVNIVC